METRELRYFVAVAEELHFARAAARVGIEQSPLSKAITEMERHLGVRLFVRTRRSTQLTFAGETLLKDARQILQGIEHAQRNVMAAASGRRGWLRIAVCDGLAHPRIAQLVARSRHEDPEIDIQLMHMPMRVQLRELRLGHVDVGFVLSPSEDPQLRTVPLWSDAVAVIMHPGHPLSGQLSIEEIGADAGKVMVLGERSLAAADPTEGWLSSAKIRPDGIERIASVELLFTLVAAGCGIGVISAALAALISRPDLVTRPLHLRGAEVTTFLLRRCDISSALLDRFTERARALL
jgi:DNA-binding transcriptional LysR family regulator